MPYPGVHVRQATPDDLAAVLALGGQLRELVGRSHRNGAGGRAALHARYADMLADPGRQVILAVDDGNQVMGMAVLAGTSLGGLLDVDALHVSHAVVAPHHRRRGAGRALVAAATAYAEEHGFDQLVVSVPPTAREANRFYARLGFAPSVVRRVAPVAVIRRSLGTAERSHPTDHLARRRTLRTALRRGEQRAIRQPGTDSPG